jgi:hypothetical protein
MRRLGPAVVVEARWDLAVALVAAWDPEAEWAAVLLALPVVVVAPAAGLNNLSNYAIVNI